MLLKIRSFYNQNRKTIWISILVLILIIVILQILNNLAKKDNKNSSSNKMATTVNNSYSVISQSNLDSNSATSINNIIDTFFEYCNNGKIDEAYSLLSNECKEELFSTKQDFINNYQANLFKTKKIFDSQAWITSDIGETYKIAISEDILSSGNSNENYTDQFFTAVKQGDEYKLNINDYIGKEEINKSETKDNIEITVISKQVYMDYEKYTIKVKNNTNKAILLDGLRNGKSVYLVDNNGGKKYAYLNEFNSLEFLIQKNLTITKEIKFNKTYSAESVIKTINFEDIILDYSTYNSNSNRNEYNNNLKFEMNV